LLLSFQKYLGSNQNLRDLTNNQVIHFVNEVIINKTLSVSTQKQLIAALSLYYKEVLNSTMNFYSVYPRNRPKSLPIILSKQEVKSILDNTTNLKHKVMLTLIYALGLRSGELINLKLIDIHKDRKQLHIKNTKGDKDRVLPIPISLKSIMNAYYKIYKPKVFLFNGQKALQYHPQSLRKVFQASCKKARITKKVTLHSLRHAYATHLMEQGVSIRVIQELLGHNSIKTTMVYTHVTQPFLQNIPSPLDSL